MGKGKCREWFEMYKKYGAVCLGTNINPKEVDAHMALMEEISTKYKIEEDFVYNRMSMAASYPIHKRLRPDSEIRKKVLDLVADLIKKEMQVTRKQVDTWIYNEGNILVPSKHIPVGNVAGISLNFPHENILRNGPIQSEESPITTDVKKDYLKPNGVKIKDVVFSDNLSKRASAVRSGDVKVRIQSLTNALSSGQLKILYEVMEKHDCADELVAIAKVLIWAKERMDNE